MHRLAVERERLHRAMRHMQDGAARRLVDAARLHADIAVLDEIDSADAVVAAKLVQPREQRGGRELLAVDGDRVALGKADGDDRRLVRRVLGADGALIDVRRRLFAGSSSTFPSEEECKRLASTENGASPRLSLATGI